MSASLLGVGVDVGRIEVATAMVVVGDGNADILETALEAPPVILAEAVAESIFPTLAHSSPLLPRVLRETVD